MLAIVVTRAGDPPRRYASERELLFGRAPQNQIVLDDPRVEDRHGRVVVVHGRYVLVDLRSHSGTYWRDKRLDAPVILTDGQAFTVVDFTLSVYEIDPRPLRTRPAAPVAPIEERLVEAVARGEPGARLVYQDWLEEQGDRVRSEYLRRLDRADDDPRQHAELAALGEHTDAVWRARISTGLVEGCREEGCPRRWSELVVGPEVDTRQCRSCGRAVRYCMTCDEARAYAPSVVDLLAAR